jgi:chromate transporter
MRLVTLAGKFLRMGATGFGGPMALIGLMQRQLVETGDVAAEDFADGVAVAQVLPGPAALNCATYLGHRLRGLPGAVVSAGGLILPAFLIMLVATPLYLVHGRVPQVAGFFKGVGPAVVAVILAAGWRMSKKFVVGTPAAVIALLVMAGAIARVNPILLVVAAGLLGILIHKPARKGEDA